MRMRRAHGPLEAGREPSPPAAIESGGPGPGDVVGGYRLVRLIGEGSRASVFLGVSHADVAPADVAPADIAADEEPAVAIKVYRPSTAAELIDREVRALTQVDHPHCLQLLDIAMDQHEQSCLILERVRVGALSRMLADRGLIAAGEAVTILAPLVSALDALHRGGVVHGGIRAGTVHFRANGAPVLAGFGHASFTEPGGAPPGVHPLVIADRVALLTLARAVLGLVPANGAARPDAVLDAAVDPAAPHFADRLGAALFDLAEPQPVFFGRAVNGTSAQVPSRAVPPSAADPPAAGSRPAPRGASHRAATTTATARVAPVRAALAAALAAASTIREPDALPLTRWTTRLRTVRPRFWAMAGGVAVSLGAALMMVPAPATPGPPGEPASAAATPAETPAATVQPGSADAELLQGDDPVAALAVLLERRDRCVRDLSVLCLDDVAQHGSAAFASDSTVIRALQAGGELTPEAAIPTGALVLVERLGDSALVALGAPPERKPASALVMKGEAGWRIRDYIP